MKENVIIIGGGPAGLLASHHLKRFGVDALILERKGVGQSWRDMREGMVMLSPATPAFDLTSLSFDNPIWSAINLTGAFATKEEFIEYLKNFVRENQLRIFENTGVLSVKKFRDGGFEVMTDREESLTAGIVVVATGLIGNPCLPEIPGIRDNPAIVHSRDYKGMENYRGKKVLIIGAGNSGAELAVELSGIAQVTLVSKQRLKYFSKTGDLSHIRGLSESLLKELIKFRIIELRENIQPVAVKNGAAFFSDGSSEAFDEMIFATGYHPNLPEFLDMSLKRIKNGFPRLSSSCESVSVRGLYFAGPLARTRGYCAFIHCFRHMIEPMALHIAERFGH